MILNAPENTPEPSILQLDQVDVGSRFIPRRVMVRDARWRVQAGDFWVVLGASGSGKTDFLLTAAGLMPPENGSVRLFDSEVTAAREEEWIEIRRRVGFVFPQGGRLFNRLTVEENLALPIRYHENWGTMEAGERVQSLLELTGLAEWAQERPEQVPRNLHERIGLARALVLRPELLVLDAPLGGLDPRQIRWWHGFLGKAAAEPASLGVPRLTFIVSTDNFALWRERGKKFGLIHDRQWIELGGAEEVAKGAPPAARELLLDDD